MLPFPFPRNLCVAPDRRAVIEAEMLRLLDALATGLAAQLFAVAHLGTVPLVDTVVLQRPCRRPLHIALDAQTGRLA